MEEDKVITLSKKHRIINLYLECHIHILNWSEQYYPNAQVLDGEESTITIYLKDEDDIIIYGQNAYPENFKEFVEECNKYSFGPYDSEDD